MKLKSKKVVLSGNIKYRSLRCCLKLLGVQTGFNKMHSMKTYNVNNLSDLERLDVLKRAKEVYIKRIKLCHPDVSNKSSNEAIMLNTLFERIKTLFKRIGITLAICYSFTASASTNTNTVVISSISNTVQQVALDPRFWGAVGDGTNDDTRAFTNCFNQALNSNSNSLIHIREGKYKITHQILIPSNTKVMLDPGAVILRSANIDNLFLNYADGLTGGYGAASNIWFEGGILDGNKSNYTSTATLIAFGHAKNITVKDVSFVNDPGTWHNLELNAVQFAQVINCSFSNSAASEAFQIDLAADAAAFPWFGPYDSNACNNILIDHCLFDTGQEGIGSHRWATNLHHFNITVRNCTFTNMTGVCIRPYDWSGGIVVENCYADKIYRFLDPDLDTTAADPGFKRYNWKILNCTIKNVTNDSSQSRAIKIKWAENILISGNTISNVSRHAIGVDAYSKNITIKNNNIFDVGQLASIGSGIIIFGASECVISGNILSNTVSPAIRIGDSTSTGITTNVIAQNNILPKDGIYIDTATNIVVTGNISGGLSNSTSALVFSSGNLSTTPPFQSFFIPTNAPSTWPPLPPYAGASDIVSSNGTMYIRLSTNGSGGGSTTFTSTNKWF